MFNCNLPPALLAERPGSFTCYCGNTGVERIPKEESAQIVDPGEENSPAAPAGARNSEAAGFKQTLSLHELQVCWATPGLRPKNCTQRLPRS